jgi:3',5'-cyclic AMP phosphodiesterase CpdA
MSSLHFAQISDMHISRLGDHHELLGGHAADFLAAAVAALNRLPDLDFVLLAGDLLDTGHPAELDRFRQAIAPLRCPYYIIPGNHDQGEPGFTRREFAVAFNPQVAARPTNPAAQAGYWSLAVKPGVQLIGLDSVRDDEAGGLIDPPQIAWLRDELEAHRDNFIIVAVHHPLHPLAPLDADPHWGRIFLCENGPQILALLDDYPQVKLVLTAHHHLTGATLFGGRRLHLAGPAVAVYPCAYRTVRLSRQRVAWQTHTLTDATTREMARCRLIAAGQEFGLNQETMEAYCRLAWGSDYDRAGEWLSKW